MDANASIDAEPDCCKWLHAIAKEPVAAVKMDEIPRVLDLTLEAAGAVMADLLDAGLVELWKERSRERVCLTPLGAERINVVALPDRRGRLQWQTRGTAAAVARPERSKQGKEGPKTVLATDLDAEDQNILDELPGPTSDELAEQGAVDLILGCGFVWPGPSVEPARGQSCRGCRHIKRMPTNAYCALCHRAGRRGLRTPPQAVGPVEVIGIDSAAKPRQKDDEPAEKPRKRLKKLA